MFNLFKSQKGSYKKGNKELKLKTHNLKRRGTSYCEKREGKRYAQSPVTPPPSPNDLETIYEIANYDS